MALPSDIWYLIGLYLTPPHLQKIAFHPIIDSIPFQREYARRHYELTEYEARFVDSYITFFLHTLQDDLQTAIRRELLLRQVWNPNRLINSLLSLHVHVDPAWRKSRNPALSLLTSYLTDRITNSFIRYAIMRICRSIYEIQGYEFNLIKL